MSFSGSAEAEYQTAVTNYATVAALAVLIWDILDNLFGDCRMLFGQRRQFRLAVAAYCVSRVAAFGYALSSTIFLTAPVGNCELFSKVANAWCPIALTSSAYLFFLRLRAIYNNSRIVPAAFFIIFLGLISAVVFVPMAVSGGYVKNTEYCHYVSVARYASIAQMAPLAYDTLVFIAISWRLSQNAAADMDAGINLRTMVFGKNLPLFTRSLLLDGQLYYLITLVAGIAAAILTFHPGVSAPLKSLANDPFLALVNIMACRVYRRTKTGLIKEPQMSTIAVDKSRITYPILIRSTSGSDSPSLQIGITHSVTVLKDDV